MQIGTAHIGTTGNLALDSLAQALELALAHLLQERAVGAGCGCFVKIDRDVVPVPYRGACLAREENALLERNVADGNEGDHVGGADARVDSALRGEVDK